MCQEENTKPSRRRKCTIAPGFTISLGTELPTTYVLLAEGKVGEPSCKICLEIQMRNTLKEIDKIDNECNAPKWPIFTL